MNSQYDLLVIGGGINGAGIARDAAGRGLRVLLCEQHDLAQHTSSASSKLIHGGLRYLEQYEFRLVAESLAEREVLLSLAPHLIHPLEFVMPHTPSLRPAWMIRAGLFLYDYLGSRRRLPASRSVTLEGNAYGAPLKKEFTRGFVYSDCRVDDARLVVLNALSASELGATVLTRTACESALRRSDHWEVSLRESAGTTRKVTTRALVNAAGPWVREVLTGALAQRARAGVKHVKGSHIVVPRRYEGEHAYILQNEDKRVVFLIPYEGEFTLIGTTDTEVGAAELGEMHITDAETVYLCAAANRFLRDPIQPEDVVWSYSGVRPLFDDGKSDPSEITRDYTLVEGRKGGAPLVSVFGGKITTYRRLAESVMGHFGSVLRGTRGAWTATAPLPGGDVPHADLAQFENDALARTFPWLPPDTRRALAHRHGSNVLTLLRGIENMEDMGRHFGAGLYAVEVDYLIRKEWARTADDVLWRRTKCGLHMTKAEREQVGEYMDEHVSPA
jgi:glycerol-3-phosphate dehydrogenase